MVDDSEFSSSLSSQSECETSQSKKARKTLIMDSQQNNQKQVQSNISKAKSSVSIHEEGEQDEEYNEETYGFNNNSIKELPDLTLMEACHCASACNGRCGKANANVNIKYS